MGKWADPLVSKNCIIYQRTLIVCSLWILYMSAANAIKNDSFPKQFLLGFATASYQIEGAWEEDGKGENIWDRLTHQHPEMIAGRANGNIAADSYHKYKEDVALLKHLGAQIYRFSLSWSRILPTGDTNIVNQAGITYYDNIINELLLNGIQPMITLYHWDLPQPLQDIGGWPNPLMADYFEQYARIVFQYFGDRVKYWITFNEPLEICLSGYGRPLLAPALDMSGIAEYLCAHTVLLSHARAYHLYSRYFRSSQGGKIGMSLSGGWNEAASNSTENHEAAERLLQFQIGWFAHPMIYGDYPPLMRWKIDNNSISEGRSRSRLPVFHKEAVDFVKGTMDYLGLNHYTTYLITNGASASERNPSYMRDAEVRATQDPSWPGSASIWLKVVPWGFRKQLNWMKKTYGDIPLFVTENGYSDNGETEDFKRISYYKDYLQEMLNAIYEDKCNVIGYIAWSLLDNFEWLDGYKAKFGIYKVDFNSLDRVRTPKASVPFFRRLLSTRKLNLLNETEPESNAIPTTDGAQ